MSEPDHSSAADSITIAQAISEGASLLREAGFGEPRREAASLLMHATGRDRLYLIAHSDERLADASLRRFRDYLERRAEGEPVQYIAGRQEFFSLDFEVTPDVLIPRPETELLVETALSLLDERRAGGAMICDVGTGSGCIAVTILHERGNVRAVGLDISPAALNVAARNARRHGISGRLSLAASDCFAALDEGRARFDLIVSNPPYINAEAIAGLQREVRDYEPRTALTPGPDGLSMIRRLLTEGPRFLMRGGYLLFEIGFDQHEDVERLVDRGAWRLLDIRRDLQGIPRTVVLKRRGR